MRHLLFDIDGTLISTGRAGSRGMLAAITELTGIETPATTEFSGRTDSHLLPELLRVNGIEPTDTLVDEAQQCYFKHLEDALEQCEGSVLPGITSLLDHLKDGAGATVGLLTGNFPHSAQMKLSYYGIWDYFTAPGYFGNISPNRSDLSRRALEDLGQAHANLDSGDIVIIGDTPMDAQCAQAINATCVAVCTGGCSADELASAGAHVVFENLENTTDVVAALLDV